VVTADEDLDRAGPGKVFDPIGEGPVRHCYNLFFRG